MLAENNSIVLVDDNENDIKRLSSIFADRGIGCRTFQYDGKLCGDMCQRKTISCWCFGQHM